jgi:hypothetical protein
MWRGPLLAAILFVVCLHPWRWSPAPPDEIAVLERRLHAFVTAVPAGARLGFVGDSGDERKRRMQVSYVIAPRLLVGDAAQILGVFDRPAGPFLVDHPLLENYGERVFLLGPRR